MVLSRFGTRKRYLAVILALTAFSALAAIAAAAHWAQFGGDAGRSNFQPVSPTALPVQAKWSKTDATEKNVRTAPIITGGATLSAQRVVFGTQNPDPSRGRVHLQRLSDGAPVGSEEGVQIDDGSFDGDTFGPASSGSVPPLAGGVSPVDTSKPDGDGGVVAGNTFVVHNDDNQSGGNSDPRTGSDIALAQIINATGLKRTGLGGGDVTLGSNEDEDLANTINFRIESSPVITPPDANDKRSIFFVANRPSAAADPATTGCLPGLSFEADNPETGEDINGCSVNAARRLFRVDIANASNENASIESFASSQDIPNLNTTISPVLANFRDPNNEPRTYVLVTTSDGFVRIYDPAALSSNVVFAATTPVFASSPDLGDIVTQPSVPVNANGTMPAVSKGFYVAAAEAGTGAGATDTFVYYISQNPDAPTSFGFDAATGKSYDLPGEPTPALAVTKLADSESPGRVAVLTTLGKYSLNAANLKEGVQNLDGAQGVARTAPSASGDLFFYSRDNGTQTVLDIRTMSPVSAGPGGFTPDPANDTASSSYGQPSISNRVVVFGSNEGVFAYQAGNPSPPPGVTSVAYAIGDSTATEGDQGEKLMTFKVTRFGPSDQVGTVKVSTQDGTAKAAEDYKPLNAELVTFDPGQTEKNISVTILSDNNDESDETFFVKLSEPTGPNATILDGEGVGVIVSDDPRRTTPGEPTPLISISDVVGVEGGNAVFTVSLSNASSKTVTVDFATADDTAKAGADYGGGSGKLTYSPGQTVKTITVPLVDDNVKENFDQIERFFMILANATNATLADNQGSGFIMDRGYDLPRQTPGLTAKTTPKKDTKAPFRFKTTGRLILPSGVSRSEGCTGRVSIQVKSAPAKTISNRRAKIDRTCRFSKRVTFKNAKRFPKSGKLEFNVRFQGNKILNRKRAKKIVVNTK